MPKTSSNNEGHIRFTCITQQRVVNGKKLGQKQPIPRVDAAGKNPEAHQAPNCHIERAQGLNNVPKSFWRSLINLNVS